MTKRDELRAAGAEVRRQLGLADWSGPELAPGLSRLSDELMFGRLWARPGLAIDDRMLATLSALTSRQYLGALRDYVGAALHIGMKARLVQEVMIHCSLYSGMPTAVASLGVVSDVLVGRGDPIPEVELEEHDLDVLDQLGRDTMQKLHQDRAQGGYASPNSAAAGLYATAIDYAYGEVWNRPGITHRQRMICSVAAFTAIDHDSQQRKFFRSARNVGLSDDEIIEVIMATGPYSGLPRALNALAVAGEVLV